MKAQASRSYAADESVNATVAKNYIGHDGQIITEKPVTTTQECRRTAAMAYSDTGTQTTWPIREVRTDIGPRFVGEERQRLHCIHWNT